MSFQSIEPMKQSWNIRLMAVFKLYTDPAWDKFVHDTVATGTEQAQTFIAGRLKNHVDFWKTITSDSVIIS